MTVIERYKVVHDGRVRDTQTGQVMSPGSIVAGLNLCEHLCRQPDQLVGAVKALREIASRPTVERNPDGDDQAAHTMQMIARETLAAIGGQQA